MIVYIIGSLRNPEIPKIANQIQEAGHEAFADWYAAGFEADDKWRDYEKERGRTYLEALKGYAAKNVFEFDRRHLERADAVVLVAPAGKSGHLELGWALGKGKRGYYLLDNPDRWDVMLQFCTMVTENLDEIIKDLDAQSLQQTSQPSPLLSGVCWTANQVGKSILTPSIRYSSIQSEIKGRGSESLSRLADAASSLGGRSESGIEG